MQFVLFTPKQSDCEPKGQIQTIFIVTKHSKQSDENVLCDWHPT